MKLLNVFTDEQSNQVVFLVECPESSDIDTITKFFEDNDLEYQKQKAIEESERISDWEALDLDPKALDNDIYSKKTKVEEVPE